MGTLDVQGFSLLGAKDALDTSGSWLIAPNVFFV